MPMNDVQERDRPRASSLGACARQQAFTMAGTVPQDIGEEASARAIDQELTAEQGRMFEPVSIKVIESMGFQVVDRQIALPDDFPVSGHPDGRLVPGDEAARFDINWGWEHKHLGRYAYEKILKMGLFKAEPQFIVQDLMYGYGFGWDAGLFTIVAQDSSSVRGDMTANLRAKNPAVRWAVDPLINPKVNHIALDLAPLKQSLLPRALERAEFLIDWKKNDGDPGHVAPEHDPNVRETKWIPDGEGGRMEVERAPFPCGWCPFMQNCIKAGLGGKVAPAFPWTDEVVDDSAE